MTRALLCSLFVWLGLGCDLNCDAEPREIDGLYTWQPDPDLERPGPSGGTTVSAQLDASEGRVVFTYELADGSRYRATYRVKNERQGN